MADKRILLVEDERPIHELLTHALRAEGYVVDVATTLADAWRELDARSYGLVIADWRLPDGDGTVIADAAAQLGAKTCVMSGYLFRMPGGRSELHEGGSPCPCQPAPLPLSSRRRPGSTGQPLLR